MTTVRRRGTGGGGVEAKNEFKIENAGEPKQPLVKTTATTAEWSKSLNGGEASKGTLTIESTSNAEKGVVNLGAKGAWQEEKITVATGKGATAPRLGIGTTTPVGYLIVEPGTSGVPEEVATAGGSTAAEVLGVIGPTGGNTSIATTGTGGTGSKILLQAGKGGEATAALTKSTGGKGGEFRFVSGVGAPCLTTTTTGLGGAGGNMKIETGGGGVGEAVTTGTGGAGGSMTIQLGAGASGKTTGGKGGGLTFTAGTGGIAATTGGNGGELIFNAGNGASANGAGGKISFNTGIANGTAKGGNIEFTASKGGEVEKGGIVTFLTEGAERVKILTSGGVEHQKGIGVWAHTVPAAQHAEIAVPGAFKKGAQGFETEGEAEAIRKKLTEVIEVLKEYGFTL